MPPRIAASKRLTLSAPAAFSASLASFAARTRAFWRSVRPSSWSTIHRWIAGSGCISTGLLSVSLTSSPEVDEHTLWLETGLPHREDSQFRRRSTLYFDGSRVVDPLGAGRSAFSADRQREAQPQVRPAVSGGGRTSNGSIRAISAGGSFVFAATFGSSARVCVSSGLKI